MDTERPWAALLSFATIAALGGVAAIAVVGGENALTAKLHQWPGLALLVILSAYQALSWRARRRPLAVTLIAAAVLAVAAAVGVGNVGRPVADVTKDAPAVPSRTVSEDNAS